MSDFLTFEQVLNYTSARHVFGRSFTPFEGVSTDSRKINAGDLFIALKGPKFDGNDFVREAVSKGAKGVLMSRLLDGASMDLLRRGEIAVGYVEDGLETVQRLASHYRCLFSIPVIGITGSCGKTTVKEMTAVMLEPLGPNLKNEGTLNNHLGVPLTLLKFRAAHRTCSVEMGTSGPGEIEKLVSIASPTVGVVLNVGPSHLKMLKGLEGVLEEKWNLIAGLNGGVGIYNEDDSLLRKKAKTYQGPLFSFGIYEGGQLRASKIELLKGYATRFSLIFEGKELGMMKIPFIGLHHVYNVLGALCIGHVLGVPWYEMFEKASQLKLPSMRWDVTRVGGVAIVNDAYNANPQSMAAALETFKAMKVVGKKIFVCADMLDLGEDEAHWHRALATEVLKAQVDIVISMGPLSSLMVEEVRKKGFPKSASVMCESHEEVLHHLSILGDSDAVLVKGSRAMGMEGIVRALVVQLQGQHHYRKEILPATHPV